MVVSGRSGHDFSQKPSDRLLAAYSVEKTRKLGVAKISAKQQYFNSRH